MRMPLRSLVFFLPLHALLAQTPAGRTVIAPKLRLAVMDLNGSALKMQSNMMPMPGSMPGATPYGTQGGSTFTIALPPPAEFARGLTEMLTTTLMASNRFVVLERLAMQQVTNEQDFTNGQRVNKETAVNQGQMIGAQALIAGDITGFSYQQTSIGGKITNLLKGVNAKVDRVSAMVQLDLRVIDAVTGEVLFSYRGQGKASATGVGADLTRDDKAYAGSGTATKPLGQASRQAIENAVAEIVRAMGTRPWSARVIDVREGMVYFNAGKDQGIEPGLELEVFDQQPGLVDPETGKNLGAPDRRIGAIVVTQVAEKYAVGKVVNGQDFKRNHLVKLKGQGETP